MTKGIEVIGGEPILDRTGVPHTVSKAFAEPVSYLEVLTDYGVQLLKRSLVSSPREVPDIVLLPVLFRQVLAFLDSVHLHLTAGAVHSAIPSVRSLFEGTLSMEWILSEGKDRWGNQYYVSELRQRRIWAAMLVPGTPENGQLSKTAGTFVSQALKDSAKVVAAQEAIRKLDAHIAGNPVFSNANVAFEALKNKTGREPKWYQPSGPSSLSDMAARLDRTDEYLILYRQWSEVSHGSRASGHIEIHPGHTLVIEPIRTIEGVDDVLNISARIGEVAILRVINEYRPDEKPRFREKVLGEWKGKREIPEIQVQTEITGVV